MPKGHSSRQAYPGCLRGADCGPLAGRGPCLAAGSVHRAGQPGGPGHLRAFPRCDIEWTGSRRRFHARQSGGRPHDQRDSRNRKGHGRLPRERSLVTSGSWPGPGTGDRQPIGRPPRTAAFRRDDRNRRIGIRPRLCENSATEQFWGSLDPLARSRKSILTRSGGSTFRRTRRGARFHTGAPGDRQGVGGASPLR